MTSLPPVPGLQPSIVASSERTRGAIMSTWVCPRRHEFQVPYCCFSAGIPHEPYVFTAQFAAAM